MTDDAERKRDIRARARQNFERQSINDLDGADGADRGSFDRGSLTGADGTA